MEWKKQENLAFWQPEKKGDEIVGTVTKLTDGVYGTHFVISTKEGDITTPAHKVLISRMSGIKVGDMVKIVFLGEELPKVKGQNPTKLYEVYKGA
jgi:hypothetical protein